MNQSGLSASLLFSAGKKHLLYTLFLIAFLGVSLLEIFQFRTSSMVDESSQWVNHTQEVILESYHLLSFLKDAETGQRGYLLTGKSAYLAPYNLARGQLKQTYQKLVALTRDNTIQQQKLVRIERLMQQKWMELDSTIQLRTSQGLNAALPLVNQDRGKVLMDSLRLEMRALQQTEQRLLHQRNNQFERSRQQIRWWQQASMFVSLGLLFTTFLLLRNQLKQQQKVGDLLVEQVHERTQALQATTEELAASNEELAASNEELSASNEEMQAANEDLAIVNEQLLNANKDLDNFMYMASHDLKSPIASMQGLLAILTKRLNSRLDDKEKEILSMLTSSVNRLRGVIGELMEIVKVQKDTSLEREKIGLSEVLAEVLADLSGNIQEADAHITTHLEVESLVYARKHIRSILYNLISNAVKYHSPNRQPTIHISTHASDQGELLTVTDNGLGLSESQQSKLFTMFKRFHNHVEGSGVGLYMIKRMVEENGGRIEVKSTLDEGTTFFVYFSNLSN